MKDREIFAGLSTTVPFVLRLDGRSFHHFSKDRYKKPYDKVFSDSMVKTSLALLTDSGFSPSFAYTFSDEISIYVPAPVFDGRVEKLVSVSAAFASSAFTIYSGATEPLAFDARVVPMEMCLFPAYLSWRQAEAWRNHMNGYVQKLLLDEGMSAADAQKKLDGMNAAALHEFAFRKGVNLAETPAWERRGICIYRDVVMRDGYNPKTNENVSVPRSMAVIDEDVPLFKTPEGIAWILSKIC
ncbi:MAG: tRNA(His) guanylyltransferase Thg1 family protein [Methanocorpusculum sp.]|nr:tRNA(His) guanylyltransferase Thg1 family protein [Methanocorpusculum sp.]